MEVCCKEEHFKILAAFPESFRLYRVSKHALFTFLPGGMLRQEVGAGAGCN